MIIMAVRKWLKYRTDICKYHEKIFSETSGCKKDAVDVGSYVSGCDGAVLGSTSMASQDNRVGIVVVPALGMPRETYYKLLCDIAKAQPECSVLVYDPRGHSFSDGEFNVEKYIQDINIIGKQFKEDNNLDSLIGVGFSFGALGLLASSGDDDPYALRVAFAPPADVGKTDAVSPESLWEVYQNNLRRVWERPQTYGEGIVPRYESSSYLDFLKNPRSLALRVDNPSLVVRELENAPKLVDIIPNVSSPTCIVYAGVDNTLGITVQNVEELSGDYVGVRDCCLSSGVEFDLWPGFSHRFNFVGEGNGIVVAGDNNKVAEYISQKMG